MKNTLLIQFSSPGNLYVQAKCDRLVRMHSGVLILERKFTDLLGESRWDVVKVSDAHCILSEDTRWAKMWKDLAIPLEKGRGEILDTRGVEELPKSAQGIIHRYSERSGNAHAPDHEEQDVYVAREMRGMAFTSRVPVMALATDTEAIQVLLGAIYLMAREEKGQA